MSAAALFSVSAFPGCEKSVSTTAAAPPEVLVTEVVQKEVPVFRQWVGTVNGVENAEVRARTEGYLTTISYQQGGYVKKGDVLFQIDSRPFVAALDQAKASWRRLKQLCLELNWTRSEQRNCSIQR
jgi:multidrug efflux pump subunit AcrA (membrane-fusion protein)